MNPEYKKTWWDKNWFYVFISIMFIAAVIALATAKSNGSPYSQPDSDLEYQYPR